MFAEHILALLSEWRRELLNAWCELHCQHCQMIAADTVHHEHIKWGRRRTLLIEAAHMEALGVGASMHDLMDGTLVAMKGEDDRLIFREMFDESCFIETMRM